MPPGESPPGAWGICVPRMLDGIERVFVWIGIALFVGMFVIVCLQVFSRYILQLPISWTEEIGRYLFVWTSFLGSAVLVGRDEHFSIDFIARVLPARLERILRVVVTVLVIGFALLMVAYGFRLSRRLLTASSPILQLSLGAVYSIVPISGLYMLLFGLARLARLATQEDTKGNV